MTDDNVLNIDQDTQDKLDRLGLGSNFAQNTYKF